MDQGIFGHVDMQGKFGALDYPSPQKMQQKLDYVDFKGFDIDHDFEVDEEMEPADRA